MSKLKIILDKNFYSNKAQEYIIFLGILGELINKNV